MRFARVGLSMTSDRIAGGEWLLLAWRVRATSVGGDVLVVIIGGAAPTRRAHWSRRPETRARGLGDMSQLQVQELLHLMAKELGVELTLHEDSNGQSSQRATSHPAGAASKPHGESCLLYSSPSPRDS